VPALWAAAQAGAPCLHPVTRFLRNYHTGGNSVPAFRALLAGLVTRRSFTAISGMVNSPEPRLIR